jgi:TonB family protein
MSQIKFVLVLLTCSTVVGMAQTTAPPQAQVQAPRPRMIRVAAAVIRGNVAHEALPKYPDEALRSGIQGDVIFKIDIDETGKIILGVPVEGDPLLVAASVEALRDFRYRPYLLGGTPIRVESEIGFQFLLKGSGVDAKGHVKLMADIPSREEFRTGVVNDKGVLILSPQKISGPAPQLPPELLGKSGSVYLTVTIGEDGKVQDVKVISGDEAFIPAVVTAVKQYVYEPQLVGGKPTVAITQDSYHFGPRS